MRLLFFLVGILLFTGFVSPAFCEENQFLDQGDQDFIFQERDLYKKVYGELGEDFSEGALTTSRKTLDRVSSMIGVSSDTYLSAIKGTMTDSVRICGIQESTKETLTTDALLNCQKRLQSLYSEEYNRNFFEWRIQYDALAREAWMNGSLLDGSFDLVVDLNVIDLILFGKEASVPSGPSPLWYDSDADSNASGDSFTQEGGGSSNAGGGGGDSQSGSGANSPSPTPSSGGDQTGQICVDPDALFFDEGGDGAGDAENDAQHWHDLQSGALFEAGEYGYLGGTYLDFVDLAQEEEEECDGEEVSIFGGTVCIPKFCTDIICIKITFVPGYRKVSGQQNIDCVECSVVRGLEVVRKLYGLSGKLTPSDAPTRNFFLTAFANLFRNVTSSVTIISKPLPFLVYKTQNDPTPVTKDFAGESPSSTPSPEQVRQEREQFYQDQNKELFDLLEKQNCESKLSSVRGDGIQSEIVEECKKDMSFLGYSLDYLQSPVDSSGKSFSETMESEKSRSSFYNDVVLPYFSQLQHSMETIDAHFLEIRSDALLKNVSSCKTRV